MIPPYAFDKFLDLPKGNAHFYIQSQFFIWKHIGPRFVARPASNP